MAHKSDELIMFEYIKDELTEIKSTLSSLPCSDHGERLRGVETTVRDLNNIRQVIRSVVIRYIAVGAVGVAGIGGIIWGIVK